MSDENYYGAPTDSSIQTLGQRLREYYAPEDFVTVINVDNTPITYQFTNPTDIETFSDYPGHKDTIQKAAPQRVTLNPGDTKLCPAYEADLMIENLIKQITSKAVRKEIDSGQAVKWQSANWSDPNVQEKLIKEIFLGKKDIVGAYNKDISTPPIPALNKDLDLDVTPEPARRGRPPKTV